jgi:hypothetical protein
LTHTGAEANDERRDWHFENTFMIDSMRGLLSSGLPPAALVLNKRGILLQRGKQTDPVSGMEV